MIGVKSLVRDYGGHLAVDHLSFRMEDSQMYGFLGPNGVGKFTIMNIITGHPGTTEGQVIIDGHGILKEPETAKKHIGYLPETPPLYMNTTVDEYLELVACIKKLSKPGRMDATQEVMDLVKITDARKQLIRNLSKGYRQRVSIAQAVLGEPSVIVLNKLTVGLDPE